MTLELVRTAGRLARLRWFEQRGHEVCGAWASTPGAVAVPAAALLAASLARHHADRAALLAEVAPHVPGVAELVDPVPADPSLAGLAHVLSGVSAPPPGDPDAWVGGVPGPAAAGLEPATFLGGHVRVVLTGLSVAYGRWAGARSAPSAPVARALRRALDDLTHDRRTGEELLDELIDRPDVVAAVAARATALERAVVVAGGILGP